MNPDAKTPEQKLRRYLGRMREIRGGNPVDEAAYYGALEELLNAVGAELKPKVVANFQLGQSGHGQPDFGLFTAEQIKRGKKAPAALPREKPARGAGEVKGLAADLRKLADSEQVGKYLDGYGLVLATNFRGFALVERDRENGKPVVLESRQIAQSEDDFWREHSAIPGQHGPALCEFLARAMTHAAPISRAEDVANLLASYAREAADALEKRGADALEQLRESLEASLGVSFDDKSGDHFFRSTLVQTIFYGLFSAWMESGGDKKFNWESAAFAVKTPVIRTLFSEIVNPVRIGGLGVDKLLDSATAALNRVDNKNELFGDGAFDAIQYFYEPFLAAFDPALRKELGVWYTPPEIVQYMVRRVDHVLKNELKVRRGLADERVRVLDPCGGTGAYLAETLRVIRKTLEDRGDGKMMAAKGMKAAAQNRVFGFEILPASFVVAHWQIGALLAKEGVPLRDGERAAVYLTNSLVGWEKEAQKRIPFPELQEERAAAGKVKRDEPILVVIGNPPYNAYAGTSPDEEGDLIAPYKEGLSTKWGIRGHHMSDLYVRFFRIAERRIVKSGRGIVSYISNYSYTTEKSFVVMRRSLLESFDKFWIENMHGNRQITEYAPDGRTSETVFAMRGKSPGIRQGVVVSLALKTGQADEKKIVRYRDDIDAAKAGDRREQLLASLNSSDFDAQYALAHPREYNRFSFRPMVVDGGYLRWPKIPDLFLARGYNGMVDRRGGAVIDFDGDALEKRMRDYFDKGIDWAAYEKTGGGLAKNAHDFNAQAARKSALNRKNGGFDPDKIVPYAIRPLDSGFCYYTRRDSIWSAPRPKFWEQAQGGNSFLVSRDGSSTDREGVPILFANSIGDDGLIGGHAFYFPFQWRAEENEVMDDKPPTNLSKAARKHLEGMGYAEPDMDSAAETLWLHALAIGHSPEYRGDNVDGLRIDWPRIPVAGARAALENSARLGGEIIRLLDSDSELPEEVSAKFRRLGVLEGPGNLSVEAGWGRRDGSGKVSPGKGRLVRREWGDELEGLTARERALLGGAVDVCLSGEGAAGTFWRGVPSSAWDFRIGGYQVLKKWLSYREGSVLGRPLRDEEALHFTGMVRRLSALVLLTDELDANYRAARDSAGEWGK